MKLYFVRHGESEANILREFSNRGFKHGLTARGFQQAEYLAQELSGTAFKQIYTSPLKRAFQTAEILKAQQDCPLEISDALREFDTGVLEGESGPESWEVHSWVMQQWFDGNWEAHITGGESHLDLQARFLPLIESLTQNINDGDILLVGHGGLFLSMLPLIFANLTFDTIHERPMAHTMPIIAETHPEGLYCTQWGEVRLEP